MNAGSHEIILHKRSLTPFEKHKRSKDVLQILSPASAVLQSPMLDGEYEFNFDQVIDDDELLPVLKHKACNNFLTALIGGGRSCFVQFGLVNQNNDGHVTTLLDHLTSELFAYIRSSSKCIEFTIQNSFVAVNKNANIDLLSANYIHGGFDASKVYVFEREQICAAFQRGVAVYYELMEQRPIHKSSTLTFTMFLTQRNTNTNHVRYSRFDYVILTGDTNHLSNVVNSLKQPTYECSCNLHRQIDDNEQNLKSCFKCHFKSILSLSRATVFALSVSPSNLEARSTLRVIQFGQFLSGHSAIVETGSENQEESFNLVQTIKHMEDLLLNEKHVDKKLKMNEKLKLRRMIDESVISFVDGDKNILLESQTREISTLKYTVGAQHEKILELEAELESRKKSDDASLRGHQKVLETSLKLSLFRERQAVYFLREFRRFYRRVLKHKAMQGDTDMHTLDSLEGIDPTLLKLGIIFEHDVAHDDAPILHSTEDCYEVSKLAAEEAFTKFISETAHDQGDIQMKGNVTDVKLLNELSVMSEAYTKLQVEIDFLRNMEILEKAPTDLVRKECLTLKTQLEKSKEELNAVVWKLNELNTTNLLLSSQANQVKRLEDLVVELQHNIRELNKDKDAMEKTLTDRVTLQRAKLDVLITPLLYPGQTHNLYDRNDISCGETFYFPIIGGEIGRNESDFENISDSKSIPSHIETESETTSCKVHGNLLPENKQVEDGERAQANVPNTTADASTMAENSAEVEADNSINQPGKSHIKSTDDKVAQIIESPFKIQAKITSAPEQSAMPYTTTSSVANEDGLIDCPSSRNFIHAASSEAVDPKIVEQINKGGHDLICAEDEVQQIQNYAESPRFSEHVITDSTSNDHASVPLAYSASTGDGNIGQAEQVFVSTEAPSQLSIKENADNVSNIANNDDSCFERDSPLVVKDDPKHDEITRGDGDQESTGLFPVPLNEMSKVQNETSSPPQAAGTIIHEPIIPVSSAISKLDGAQMPRLDARPMLDKHDEESLSTLTAENSRKTKISLFAGGRSASEKPVTFSRKMGPSIRSGVVSGKSKRRNKRIIRSSS